jgi:hypothetical protein
MQPVLQGGVQHRQPHLDLELALPGFEARGK